MVKAGGHKISLFGWHHSDSPSKLNGDNNDDYNDEDELNQVSENFMRRNPLGLLGTNSAESVIVSGQNVENGGRRRGHPTTQVARCANSGRQICKHLCDARP